MRIQEKVDYFTGKIIEDVDFYSQCGDRDRLKDAIRDSLRRLTEAIRGETWQQKKEA